MYEFHRLPFGLCGAAPTFQRLMDRVLDKLKWKECLVYMDDILIMGCKISKTNHGCANPFIRRDGVLLQEIHQRIASIAQPLSRLLKKGANVQNQWGEEQEKAWLTLKKRLSSAPVLSHNDGEAPLEITVDASLFGLGAVLQVSINEVWKPVTYISRKLDPAEENYHANELEALGFGFGFGFVDDWCFRCANPIDP